MSKETYTSVKRDPGFDINGRKDETPQDLVSKETYTSVKRDPGFDINGRKDETPQDLRPASKRFLK